MNASLDGLRCFGRSAAKAMTRDFFDGVAKQWPIDETKPTFGTSQLLGSSGPNRRLQLSDEVPSCGHYGHSFTTVAPRAALRYSAASSDII